MNNNSIKVMSEEDRPREKLFSCGAQSLTNEELFTIIIGSGTKKSNAKEIARNILREGNNNIKELSKKEFIDLLGIDGVGNTKAATVVAVMELCKRYASSSFETKIPIKSSSTAAQIMAPLLSGLKHEECWIMYLNRANRIISTEMISKGGLYATVVDTKIIIKNALIKLSSSLILFHNHPSGNTIPGDNDKRQTAILKDAAELMEISLIDHIIIAEDSYFSFADNGLI